MFQRSLEKYFFSTDQKDALPTGKKRTFRKVSFRIVAFWRVKMWKPFVEELKF